MQLQEFLRREDEMRVVRAVTRSAASRQPRRLAGKLQYIYGEAGKLRQMRARCREVIEFEEAMGSVLIDFRVSAEGA